jgi:WD repeat-containing protein 35
MRDQVDERPVLVNTGLRIAQVRWSSNGSVLAVAGKLSDVSDDEDRGIQVQFYSPFGVLLRTLKVAGKQIRSVSWEGGGLRLALAVDNFIYFANVRPNYRWCAFGDTIAFSYPRADRPEQAVVFWDTKTNERYPKSVRRLLGLAASPLGEVACIARAADEAEAGNFNLALYNSIGVPVDERTIPLEPTLLAMTSTTLLAASRTQLYCW